MAGLRSVVSERENPVVLVLAAYFRRLSVVSVIFLLAACGGGGGGGEGSNDAYSVSPTSVTFTTIQNGATPSSQQASVSVNHGAVYIRVDSSGSPIASATFQITGSTTGVITITPVSPTMSPGTYTGTVTVYGCTDQFCSSSVAGSPKVVNVTYTIQPRSGLAASPQSLSFSQIRNGAAPSAQNLSVSERSSANYAWTASIVYQSGSGWLTINGAASTSGASLPAALSVGIIPLSNVGTYTALIRVSGNGNTIDIPVTYTVQEPPITATPASLTFNAISHDAAAPAAQDLALSTPAGLSVNYTAAVIYGTGASGWLTAPASGTAPGNISVSVNTTNLNVRTYTATLRLTTATQTLSIPVTYTVRAPQVTRLPTQLNFTAPRQGAIPTAQNVAIGTENNISLPYTTSISYGTGASGWLSIPASGNAPGNLAVSVNTTNLNAGNYTATITLQPGYGVPAITVGVSYQVQNVSLTVTPSPVTYTIDNNSSSADLNRTLNVGDTGFAMAWTASASVPWLTIGTTSGTTAGNGTITAVALTLVSSEIESLDAGSHSGNVSFSFTRPDASVGTLQLAVTLNMNLPKVNFVSPYVAPPNTSREVIVRGSGFNYMAGLPLMFGSNAVSNYNVLGNNEIRVTHPTLSAGSHSVNVQNQLGLNRTRARLLVQAVPTYSYTVLPTSLVRSRTLFDAERMAIYTNNWGVGYGGPAGVPRVERHRLVNGTWATDSIVLPGAPYDIALTPDGRELIALTAATLFHVDLDSWTIVNQTANPLSYSNLSRIAMSNDGNALVHIGGQWVTMYRYNVLTRTFAPVPGYANVFYGGISPVASLDGSRILVGQNGLSGTLPLYYFDTSLSQFVQALPNLVVNRMSYDRTGTYSLIDGRVYNRQFQSQGLEYNLLLGAISPEGTRAYGFVSSGTGGTLRTYDLTSPTVSGGFTEIGTGVSIAASPGSYVNVAITSDGGAMIISGESNLIIQPVQ